jgi:hypothetical protein
MHPPLPRRNRNLRAKSQKLRAQFRGCPVFISGGAADADGKPRAGLAARVSGCSSQATASCRAVDEGAAGLGILIEDAWQRRGLGARLVRPGDARQAGLLVLEAQPRAEQAWITGLLRPHGTCTRHQTGDGVLSVALRLSG